MTFCWDCFVVNKDAPFNKQKSKDVPILDRNVSDRSESQSWLRAAARRPKQQSRRYRLPLLSARPAVTSPAAEHHRPLKVKCAILLLECSRGAHLPPPRRPWARKWLYHYCLWQCNVSATPDLRLPSHITLVPNLYCLVTVDCPGY